MKVNELLRLVRHQLNDPQGQEFKDDELIDYINFAITFISQICIEHSYSGLLKSVVLTSENGEFEIPSDFVKEEVVYDVDKGQGLSSGQYSIIGNAILAPNSKRIRLIYYSQFPLVSSIEDNLPVPYWLTNILASMVIVYALNRVNVNTSFEFSFMADFRRQIEKICSEFSNSNIELSLPFRIN